MTDWGGSHGAVATMYSGNDLIMPGNNPAEVINATKKVPPTIDVAGPPVYTTTVRTSGLRYSWQFGGLALSATGGETISTTVDSTTDLSNPPVRRLHDGHQWAAGVHAGELRLGRRRLRSHH